MARDVHVEAGKREVAQLAIVVEEHAGQQGLVLVKAAGNGQCVIERKLSICRTVLSSLFHLKEYH